MKINASIPHEIIITERKGIQLTGVTSMESFDSEEFLLQTAAGYLVINGQDLKIQNLNLEEGILAIEGYIIGINYLDSEKYKNKEQKSLWSRLFR